MCVFHLFFLYAHTQKINKYTQTYAYPYTHAKTSIQHHVFGD